MFFVFRSNRLFIDPSSAVHDLCTVRLRARSNYVYAYAVGKNRRERTGPSAEIVLFFFERAFQINGTFLNANIRFGTNVKKMQRFCRRT